MRECSYTGYAGDSFCPSFPAFRAERQKKKLLWDNFNFQMAKKTLLSSHLLGFQRIHLPPKWKDSANSLKMNLGFLESSSNITKKAGSPMNHFCEIIGITPKSIFALISTSSLGCRAETRDATVGLRPTGNFNERPSNAFFWSGSWSVFPKFPYLRGISSLCCMA